MILVQVTVPKIFNGSLSIAVMPKMYVSWYQTGRSCIWHTDWQRMCACLAHPTTIRQSNSYHKGHSQRTVQCILQGQNTSSNYKNASYRNCIKLYNNAKIAHFCTYIKAIGASELVIDNTLCKQNQFSVIHTPAKIL